ncbi:class I SAM-dependent methyltransferase [Nocardioidaceae bacterium]|nr:class I SAM-dependent methyltransferase [Nocardioidaceae bacterium]
MTTTGTRPVTPVGLLDQQLGTLTGKARAAAASLARAGASPERDAARAEVTGLLDDLVVGLEHATRLAGGLDPYLVACTTPESPDLAALARRTVDHDWTAERVDARVAVEAEMLSGHVEGELLATLVAVTGAVEVLEIGMFTGYAALAMAQALPEDGSVVACELDPGVAAFAAECFAGAGAGDRVDVRVGPAGDTLAALASDGRVFDLVFLDADKRGYRAYVETLLDEGLLARDGLLVVDNTLMQGEPWAAGPGAVSDNGEAVAAFNTWLAQEPRVRQVLVPLRDGVTLVRWADTTDRTAGRVRERE